MLKKMCNWYFCVLKVLKSTVDKKVTMCFYDLDEENFWK